MGKIIGIDLGTTNSCVAIMEGGVPKVIENAAPFPRGSDGRLAGKWQRAWSWDPFTVGLQLGEQPDGVLGGPGANLVEIDTCRTPIAQHDFA